jgi:hypothetical protein
VGAVAEALRRVEPVGAILGSVACSRLTCVAIGKVPQIEELGASGPADEASARVGSWAPKGKRAKRHE